MSQKNSPQHARTAQGDALVTWRIRVYGIVQGVGFRPTVDRHATTAGIAGTVCNKGPYVEIYAQGSRTQVERFVELLRTQPPRRAAILKLDVRPVDELAQVRLLVSHEDVFGGNVADHA